MSALVMVGLSEVAKMDRSQNVGEDEFVADTERALEATDQAKEGLYQRLGELRRERAFLLEMLDRRDREIAETKAQLDAAGSSNEYLESLPLSRERSITAAVKYALKTEGRPLSPTEIRDVLIEAGF